MNNSGKTFDFGEIDAAADAPSENAGPDKLAQAELEPAASANHPHPNPLPKGEGTLKIVAKAVAIIGGGLAGMAAAALLSQRGLQVDLFEQSERLGGRAGSFTESWNGQLIDQCQHVAMGCCGSFLDFCKRTGVADCFQRHKTLHFIGPDGRQSDIRAAAWLPAPCICCPGFSGLNISPGGNAWA